MPVVNDFLRSKVTERIKEIRYTLNYTNRFITADINQVNAIENDLNMYPFHFTSTLSSFMETLDRILYRLHNTSRPKKIISRY